MSNFPQLSQADIQLLKLDQPLTGRSAQSVEQKFKELARLGVRQVILILEDVPFIDGQGLATLIAGFKIFGGDPRSISLVAPRVQHQLLFELTGFDKIFHIADQISEIPHLAKP